MNTTKNPEHEVPKAENKVANPHDIFFKAYWSNPETAGSFLTEYLPAKVAKLIDFDSLVKCENSFIDEKMQAFYSDMLYQVKIQDKDAFIYCLFEHKSYTDSSIFVQLLRYMLEIWTNYLKENAIVQKATNLPLILPLVLYHGKEKWNMPTCFNQCFQDTPEELKPYIPNFLYNLYDLSIIPDEEIKGITPLKIGLFSFKYVKRPEMKEKRRAILHLANFLDNNAFGKEALIVLITYLQATNTFADMQTKEAIDFLQNELSPQQGETVMTLFDHLREQGRQEQQPVIFQEGWQGGLFEGRQEGVRQTAFQFKQLGTPIDIIERATGLSREEIEGLDGSQFAVDPTEKE